jgi:Sulfotransferase family
MSRLRERECAAREFLAVAGSRYASKVTVARSLTPEVRSRLRYVQVGASDIDLRLLPDFFIAGPQRTGTTWLHANLRLHPEIFLSEPKELYYFSRLKTPADPKFQSADLSWYLSFFRERPALWAYKQASSLLRHRRLYTPKIRGEATASYAALDRDVIAEVALLNPEIRIVMMVRDPVERAWSHAKKDLARNRGRPLEEVTDDELRGFFRDPYQVRCAQYAANLKNWAAHLPREQILVERFDDVAARPEGLLVEVMKFLGVAAERRYMPPSVREPINPTTESVVPERHRRFLEELLGAEIESWRREFS